MEEIFNEVKVNEYKIGSLWRSFYSSIVALLLSFIFNWQLFYFILFDTTCKFHQRCCLNFQKSGRISRVCCIWISIINYVMMLIPDESFMSFTTILAVYSTFCVNGQMRRMPPCLTRIGCSSHAGTGALSQPYTYGHVIVSRLSQSLTLGMALVMSALPKFSGCNRLEFI